MSTSRNGNEIEALIRRSAWKPAQALIEKQLGKEPDDHWLWSRLSAVKYEQRDYQAASDAAEKALAIVPDCPLALWSKASALEMRGKTRDAIKVYIYLIIRGLSQLKSPDEDANECWEGVDWTLGLVADSSFRAAGCMAKTGRREKAVEMYLKLLSLPDMGIKGSIYSREEILKRVNKLVPTKKARREAVMRRMMEKELIPSQ